MTPIDLRLKYKSETGYAPTYGRFEDSWDTCNYKGALTHEYVEWIENKEMCECNFHRRTPDWKRKKYLKNTGHHAIYYKNGMLHYYKEYREWAEEEYCRANTLI